ncbi:MAG: ATP-binding protein [Candidatus Lokiarchaeota archaeon]|nr:ATP-binding protein [Candidatus Lokiarchaeota archaeon]
MEKRYKKEVKSDPDVLVEVEKFMLKIAKDVNMDSEKHNNFILAISEALANSIIHGNKCDSTKKVFIEVIADNEKVIVKIKDQGDGFNVDYIPDPTEPENILKDTGRGIHIMRAFADYLEYLNTEDGTETKLVFKLI